MSTTETTDGAATARGLSEAEAADRLRRGESNTTPTASTRSYATILRTNVFSFFTIILFVIGVALLAMGRYSDALISVGLGLINALISATQEIRAKHKLDQLQLLDRTPVVAVRDGAEVVIAPEAVVRGDVLRVRAGDQIVVDGPLLPGGPVEADESLLTGESDPVVKNPGDDLRSGSLCVAGEGHLLARDVGAASYAGRLTADARRATTDTTPLQRRITFVVRLVMTLTVLMSGAILAQALLEGFTLVRIVQITAVLSGLVPYGLFFLIAVAYTAGAARIAGSGALVQQVNAVESVSNVDVVCTDKTGTLTTGQLRLTGVEPVGDAAGPDASAALGAFAAAVTVPNLTTAALAAALPAPGSRWAVREEVPFASSLRWSGLATDAGVWVLGAPEALTPHLSRPPCRARRLRVLVDRTARRPAGTRCSCRADRSPPPGRSAPRRPAGAPGGWSRSRWWQLARRAAPGGRGDDARFRRRLDGRGPLVAHRVFAVPRAQGAHRRTAAPPGPHVASPGVNDSRALKAAQVGVAMRSGSAVTRDVADIVLVDDSFAALLPAQREGRKIINGIATSMYVFLARVGTQSVVILAVTMLGLGFPYSPTQVGLTLFTVGVPTLFLTLWARPTPPDPNLLSNIARFAVPAAIVTGGVATAVYAFLYESVTQFIGSGRSPAQAISDFESYTGLTYTDADFTAAAATIGAQTGLSTFVCLASFILILFLAPPARFFAAWTPPVADRRPTVLVAVLVAAFAAVLFVPVLYRYFGLTAGNSFVVRIVGAAVVLWFAALSAAYHYRLLDRVLGLEQIRDAPGR